MQPAISGTIIARRCVKCVVCGICGNIRIQEDVGYYSNRIVDLNMLFSDLLKKCLGQFHSENRERKDLIKRNTPTMKKKEQRKLQRASLRKVGTSTQAISSLEVDSSQMVRPLKSLLLFTKGQRVKNQNQINQSHSLPQTKPSPFDGSGYKFYIVFPDV